MGQASVDAPYKEGRTLKALDEEAGCSHRALSKHI